MLYVRPFKATWNVLLSGCRHQSVIIIYFGRENYTLTVRPSLQQKYTQGLRIPMKNT